MGSEDLFDKLGEVQRPRFENSDILGTVSLISVLFELKRCTFIISN